MERRTVLALPFAALMGEAAAQAARQGDRAVASSPIDKVAAGADRQGRTHRIGVSATSYKVVTSDTKGDLFVIEQANRQHGGPPLHLHHGEDELFYVLEGDYLVQVGERRFALKSGDCVLGPRGVPHAWAFVGGGAGRMLLSYAPAGKMEAYFNAWEQHGFATSGYSRASDAALLAAYGMERVGPPIRL